MPFGFRPTCLSWLITVRARRSDSTVSTRSGLALRTGHGLRRARVRRLVARGGRCGEEMAAAESAVAVGRTGRSLRSLSRSPQKGRVVGRHSMTHEMNSAYLDTAVKALRDMGVACAPGLTAGQIDGAEAEYGFRFPTDLRAFLEYVLPVGERFPDWRSPRSSFIRDRLAWPASMWNTTLSGCPHGGQSQTRWRRLKPRLATPCAQRRS